MLSFANVISSSLLEVKALKIVLGFCCCNDKSSATQALVVQKLDSAIHRINH